MRLETSKKYSPRPQINKLNAKTRALAKRRELRAFEERYHRGNFKKVKNKVRAIFSRQLVSLRSRFRYRGTKEKEKERERETLEYFCFVRSRNFIIKLFFRFRKAYRELTRSIFLSFLLFTIARLSRSCICVAKARTSRGRWRRRRKVSFFLSARV